MNKIEDMLYNNAKYNATTAAATKHQQMKQQPLTHQTIISAVGTATQMTGDATSYQLASKLRQIKENLEKSIQNNPNQIQNIINQQQQPHHHYQKQQQSQSQHQQQHQYTHYYQIQPQVQQQSQQQQSQHQHPQQRTSKLYQPSISTTPSNASTMSINSSSYATESLPFTANINKNTANTTTNQTAGNQINNRINQFKLASQTVINTNDMLTPPPEPRDTNTVRGGQTSYSMSSEDSFYKKIMQQYPPPPTLPPPPPPVPPHPNSNGKLQAPLLEATYSDNLSRQSSVRSLISLDKKITEMAQTRKLMTTSTAPSNINTTNSNNQTKQPPLTQHHQSKSTVAQQQQQHQQSQPQPQHQTPLQQQAQIQKNEKLLLLNWETFDTQSNCSSSSTSPTSSKKYKRPETRLDFHHDTQTEVAEPKAVQTLQFENEEYTQQYCFSEDGSTTASRASNLKDAEKSINSELIDSACNLFYEKSHLNVNDLSSNLAAISPLNHPNNNTSNKKQVKSTNTPDNESGTSGTSAGLPDKYERYKRLSSSINKIFTELFDNFDNKTPTTGANPTNGNGNAKKPTAKQMDSYLTPVNTNTSVNESQFNNATTATTTATQLQISKLQSQQSKQNLNDLSLIERYLNSEQQYGDVLRLLECAYAENGNYLVDYSLVEYILSQNGITFNTFKQSIIEKYNDVEWNDDLLKDLYVIVNKNTNGKTSAGVMGEIGGSNNKNGGVNSECGESTNSTNMTPTNKSFLKIREIKYVSQQKKKNRTESGSLRPQQQQQQQHQSQQQQTQESKAQSQKSAGTGGSIMEACGILMKSNKWQKEIENFIDKNFYLNKYKSKRVGSLPDLKFSGTGNHTASFNQNTSNKSFMSSNYGALGGGGGQQNMDDYYSSSSSYQLESSLKQYNAFILDILRPNGNLFKSKSTTDLNNSFLINTTNQNMNADGLNMSSNTLTDGGGGGGGTTVATLIAEDMKYENLDTYRGLVWQCADMCYNEFFLKYEELHWLLDGGSFSIESKLKEVDQRLLIDMKLYANNEKVYLNLIKDVKENSTKNNEDTFARLCRQLDTLKDKINELKSMRLFLLMCKANTNSLDPNTLDFVFSTNKTVTGSLKSEKVLQARSVSNILISLYGSETIRNGFAYQFFVIYRYFYSSIQLFDFLSETFRQSLRINEPNIKKSLLLRTIDLLAMWVDGFFSIDFQKNDNLFELFENFVQNEVTTYDVSTGRALLKLLLNPCLEFNTFALSNRQSLINLSKRKFKNKSNSKLNKLTSKSKSSKQNANKSFLTTTSGDTTIMNTEQYLDDMFNESSHFNELHNNSAITSKSFTSFMSNGRYINDQASFTSRKIENFSIDDYPIIVIASQFTLMEWDNFLNIHPCHCLNSKAQGIYTDSRAPINAQNIFNEQSSLFIENYLSKSIYKMIEFNYLVKHWTASEILSANTHKHQVALITRFLAIAKLCCDWSNFSTAFSIYDGLQEVIIKQLPAWKHVSNKTMRILDTIASFKLLLQNEPLFLHRLCQSTSLPVIPSMHLFLLTIQQNELGSFQLINGLWKWSKLSYLATLVDQIRIIQQHYVYSFHKYENIINLLLERIEWFKEIDLNTLAENGHDNYYNPKLNLTLISDVSSVKNLSKKPSIYSMQSNQSNLSQTAPSTPNFINRKKS